MKSRKENKKKISSTSLIKKISNPFKSFLKEISKIINEVKNMKKLTFKEWIRTTAFIVLASVLLILIMLLLDIMFYELRDKYLL